MSVRAQAWAYRQDTGDATAKLILVTLGDHADDHGRCWPALDRVALYTHVSRRTVQRHVKRLEEAGLLSIQERRTASGRQTSHLYRLHLEVERPIGGLEEADEGEGDRLTPSPEEAPKPVGGEGDSVTPSEGDNLSRGGCQVDTGRVTPVSPSIEPSVEPPPAPPRGRAREGPAQLEGWLGELHRPALDALRGLAGWDEIAEDTFLARYVSGPTGELLLRGVPEDLRPAVIAECVYQYLEPREDGTPVTWSGARFGGWLRRACAAARRTVQLVQEAEATGTKREDGSVELEGGGRLLPDGRRLTAFQARQLDRVMASVGGAS